MRDSLVHVLRINRENLMKYINVDETFWTRLETSRAVTQEHTEKCKSKSTKREQLELLLDMMERRDDSCFDKFCEAISTTQPDIVKKYLKERHFLLATKSVTETFTGSDVTEQLERLKEENKDLIQRLLLESDKFNDLERVNTEMQDKLETAVAEVRSLEKVHHDAEEKFKGQGEKLQKEKELTAELEKQKELLAAEIGRLEMELAPTMEKKKKLEELVQKNSQDNRKLKGQISYQNQRNRSTIESFSRSQED